MRTISYRKTTLPFLLLFSLVFTSCRGQNGIVPKSNDTDRLKIGEVVTELDTAIWSMFQDDASHYWFGSNGNGAYSYDGKTLIHYTVKDGLAGSQIRGIQGDNKGYIYFDTPEGISQFDGEKFTTLEPVLSADNKWKSAPGDLWFKGNGDPNGVYRFDGQTLYFLTFPVYDLQKFYGPRPGSTPYSPYGVYSIYKDSQGILWFGTLSAGVYRFDGDTLNYISEKELSVLDDGRVPGVRSIIEDKDGNFWLSNIISRYKINATKGEFSYEKLEGIATLHGRPTMSFPYFMSAVRDNEHNDLWMLTYREGVWRYDGQNMIHYPIYDRSKEVLLYAMYKDREGTIWLCTHNAGLYRFNGEDFEKFEL